MWYVVMWGVLMFVFLAGYRFGLAVSCFRMERLLVRNMEAWHKVGQRHNPTYEEGKI